MMGREYMRKRGETPQIIATVPLLIGTDGVQKMSKSLGNHIGITDEPFEMFSKVMSISDPTMEQWIETLGFDPSTDNPFFRKLNLAFDIVSWLHDDEAATDAKEQWQSVFSLGNTPANIPNFRLDMTHPNVGMRIDKLMCLTNLAPSVTEAGRLIKAGAVSINGVVVRDHRMPELHSQFEIKVGRKWAKITQG
jgi:tyrosyl-tRNA synthetase